jgi:hypothetical protein
MGDGWPDRLRSRSWDPDGPRWRGHETPQNERQRGSVEECPGAIPAPPSTTTKKAARTATVPKTTKKGLATNAARKMHVPKTTKKGAAKKVARKQVR